MELPSLSTERVRHLQEVLERPDFADDRYTVLGLLGRGGVARVYLAHDQRLGREVAVKVTAASVLDRDAARALEEARVVGRLEHPGIVPVYDAGQLADGRTYCVMRRVRGVSLADYCAPLDADIDLGARLDMFDRLCDAVAFAHDAGVLHCDLTPRNVMVGDFGEVFVMDWGGAARTSVPSEIVARGEVTATEGFSAPEQADPHAALSARTDVFALGRLLECCVGLPGMSGAVIRLGGRKLGVRDLRPLRAVVARATDPVPDARYSSVVDLADDVRRYAFAEPVSAYRESVVEWGFNVVRRHRAIVGLVGSYILMRALLLLWR